MIARDSVFLALRAITAHRMRSFLTLAGIAVGIAAVILLTSIGASIHRYMLAEFSQFGTNVVGIAPGKVKVGGGPPSGLPTSVRPLTIEDAVALECVPSVVGVAPTAWGNAGASSTKGIPDGGEGFATGVEGRPLAPPAGRRFVL